MSLSLRGTYTLAAAAAALAISVGTAALADAHGSSPPPVPPPPPLPVDPSDVPPPPTTGAGPDGVSPQAPQDPDAVPLTPPPPQPNVEPASREAKLMGKTVVVPLRCARSGRVSLRVARGPRLGSGRFKCVGNAGVARIKVKQEVARRLARRSSWRLRAKLTAGDKSVFETLTLRASTEARAAQDPNGATSWNVSGGCYWYDSSRYWYYCLTYETSWLGYRTGNVMYTWYGWNGSGYAQSRVRTICSASGCYRAQF